MAEHNDSVNNLDFIAPDGSYQEKVLDYLASMGNDGKVTSVSNTSTTLLTNGATFTGTAELNTATDVMVAVKTDQNGTFYCEFSPDGTNWDTSLSFKYDTARINPPHVFVKGNRYFRVRFTNDSGSDQTYLRLYTYYGSFQKLTAPINGTLAENYDAIVTRPTDYKYEVAMGKRQGRKTWNKWGYNADVDSASPEIIASFGGTFTVMTTADTFTITYNNTTDGLGTTGATQLAITYLDENYLEQTAIHTLSNTGSDVTSFTGFGINRAVVYANGGDGYNTSDITFTATTAGTTQAQIPALGSATQQAIFHTQINHNFLADWLCINVRKLSGGTAPRVTIKGFSYSRFTDTVYEICRYDIDTSVENTMVTSPSQPFVLGGREVLYFTADTNTNDTVVNLRFSGIEERVL